MKLPLHEFVDRDRIKEYLKRQTWLRPARLANMEWRSRRGGLPDWGPVLLREAEAWQEARRTGAGPKVLVATSVGGHLAANSLDSALAVALTLRGARVHGLLCDRAMPACMACETNWYPDPEHFVAHGPSRTLCGPCHRPASAMWSALGLPMHGFSAWITPDDASEAARIVAEVPANEMDDLVVDGISVGAHGRAGTLRYFARGTLDDEPHALAVRRRFLEAAIVTARAAGRLLRAEGYEVCVLHHGIYVPQGVIAEVARRHGVRVVTWNTAYRSQRFIFSHDDTYHNTMMDEPVSAWKDLAWSQRTQAATSGYMNSRIKGSQDWITYQEGSRTDIDEISRQIGIDFSRPTIALFTNVFWDAQLFYRSNAFPNMRDWLVATVDHFSRRPDLQLVIRIHPAEIQNPMKSRQTVAEELAKAFPRLPPNVFVIPPENRANSYAVATASNAALIYGTKMGVELACLGIPTIVAGEAWIRGKGITWDASSADEYRSLLDRLPLASRLAPAVVEQAHKYAFHFFFRRMIPVEFAHPRSGWPPFRLDVPGLDVLRPGRSQGLDVICDGILTGTPFIYPAETLISSEPDVRPACR